MNSSTEKKNANIDKITTFEDDVHIGITFIQTKQIRSVIDGMSHLKPEGIFNFTKTEFAMQCETRTSPRMVLAPMQVSQQCAHHRPWPE